MSKFVTKTVKEIKGQKRYEQLIVLPDSTDISKLDLEKTEKMDGVWDEYEKSLEARYKGSFNGLTAIMNRDAKMQSLTEQKFKDVTPRGELVKEYEIKYQDLRAFAIKIPNGKLILLGGYKNQQKADFAKFRSLKEQYLKSLKSK